MSSTTANYWLWTPPILAKYLTLTEILNIAYDTLVSKLKINLSGGKILYLC
jgi:hypothetical protein